MIKGLVVGVMLATVTVLGTSQTSYALHTVDGVTQSLLGRAQQAQEHVQSVVDRRAEKQADIDAKRQAIEQRLAERRAAVTEKLSGERVERCEKKEPMINQVLDTRVDAAQKHFDKLRAIHEKLDAFVTEKQLSVDNASALTLILSEKQDDAQAAIDAVKALDFECTIADAHAPGLIVIDQMTETKQALKDYRTVIKDYAVAIRSAAAEAANNETTETDTNEQTQEVTQ